MAAIERLAEDLQQAMRARDELRVRTLRMLRAALLNAEKETGRALSDEAALAVLQRQARQRRDSIEAYQAAGRDDLVAAEAAELAVIETYLPAPLGDDELRQLVAAAIAEAGAVELKQLGAVMKLVIPRVQGRADGARVSALVRELLG